MLRLAAARHARRAGWTRAKAAVSFPSLIHLPRAPRSTVSRGGRADPISAAKGGVVSWRWSGDVYLAPSTSGSMHHRARQFFTPA